MVRSPDSRLQRDSCQMMHAQEQIEHQTWLPLEPQYRDQTALQTTMAGNRVTLDKQGKKNKIRRFSKVEKLKFQCLNIEYFVRKVAFHTTKLCHDDSSSEYNFD